jgi:phospholipid/cholesterol/gamma-HCH transport system substrate-binding protein
MYASRTTQFIVGIFGVVGIAALAVLSIELGKIPLLEPPSYTVYANFDNVSGLKEADSVEIAGVEVGKVIAISLSQERARVAMQIHSGVKIDDEAIAAIKTSGIIGEKYVSIAPGAGDRTLKNGDSIMQTESAFVLEDAIGQLINSSGTSGGGNSDKDKGEKGAGNQSKPDNKKK